MDETSSPTSPERSSDSRRGLAIVAWSVLAALQIALAFMAALLLDEDEVGRDGLYEYGTAIGNAFVYLVLLGLTVAIAGIAGRPSVVLGLRSFAWRWVGAAIGIGIGVAALSYLIAALLGLDAGSEQGILPEDWRPERAGAIAANAVVIVVAAPLVEELFFRGAGVGLLQSFGAVTAMVVTGVAFGLAHGLLIGLLPLAVFGIGLAWVRLRSTSVWPCVIGHALYNGAVLSIGLLCLSDAECRATLGCVM